MNSAIQLFLNYKVIKKFLMVNNFTDNRLNVLKQFIMDYEPKPIKLLLGQKNKQFIGSGQNDSHECLITLLDIIENGIKSEDTMRAKMIGFEKKITIGNTNIPMTKLLDSVLNINVISYVKCLNCSYLSETKKDEKILSVSITNNTNTMLDCIREFEKEEVLNDDNKWKCDKCNNLVCAKKWLQIKKYPKYLTIHLKRFTNNIHKNGKSIEVPMEMSLNNNRYRLVSYILHSGGLNGGHYVNYSRINDKFYLLNDSNVSESDPDNVNQGYIYLFSKIY